MQKGFVQMIEYQSFNQLNNQHAKSVFQLIEQQSFNRFDIKHAKMCCSID